METQTTQPEQYEAGLAEQETSDNYETAEATEDTSTETETYVIPQDAITINNSWEVSVKHSGYIKETFQELYLDGQLQTFKGVESITLSLLNTGKHTQRFVDTEAGKECAAEYKLNKEGVVTLTIYERPILGAEVEEYNKESLDFERPENERNDSEYSFANESESSLSSTNSVRTRSMEQSVGNSFTIEISPDAEQEIRRISLTTGIGLTFVTPSQTHTASPESPTPTTSQSSSAFATSETTNDETVYTPVTITESQAIN
jgi:hypothetical protein